MNERMVCTDREAVQLIENMYAVLAPDLLVLHKQETATNLKFLIRNHLHMKSFMLALWGFRNALSYV